MLKVLYQTFLRLLGSSKFVAGFVTAITAALMRFGFDVSQEDVAMVVGPLVAAILGQSIADAGKSKAEVVAGKTHAEVVADSAARTADKHPPATP